MGLLLWFKQLVVPPPPPKPKVDFTKTNTKLAAIRAANPKIAAVFDQMMKDINA